MFGLQLRCSEDGTEYTEVTYSVADRTIRVDRTHASEGETTISEVHVNPMADGCIKLHLFLDRSSVELFVNDGVKTVTNRIYPKKDSLGVKPFTRDGAAFLVGLDVWEL